MHHAVEEHLRTPVAGHYDVIVAGGGPAGVPAAVQAARQGARVLLLESNGCLGGVWTAGMLAWVFDIEGPAIGRELTGRLGAQNACVFANGERMVNFTYDIETMKVVLETMCAEARVDVRLHTRLVAAQVDADRRLRAVVTESKSGRQAWTAKAFVDCTGDGDLGALAGNAFDMGSGSDGRLQPMTLMGLLAVRDLAAVADQVSFLGGRYNHIQACGRFKNTLDTLGIATSYAHPTLFHVRGNLLALMVNHQYGVDATDAGRVSAATIAARAEVYRVADALAKSATPFRDAVLTATAEHIGVREGRRLAGRCRLTHADLVAGRRHEDAVCQVRFNIDVHSSDPAKDKGLATEKVPAYDIPLRALIARDVDGLLMAGRCISGDWLSFASYRVTGSAVGMGSAAGLVAARSAAAGIPPHEVVWADVKAQQ